MIPKSTPAWPTTRSQGTEMRRADVCRSHHGWRPAAALTVIARVLTGGLLLSVLGACSRGDADTTRDATPESASARKASAARPTADSAAGGHSAEIVTLDSAAVRLGGIQVDAVTTITSTGLPVTGSITYDPNRVSHVGPRTDGRVLTLRANLGDRVSRGEVLAVLESPEVGQLRAEEREAEELVRIARENYAREQGLARQGISSRKELLDAEAELRRNQAALRSAESRLDVLGAAHDHSQGGRFSLTAPFAGSVVARDASPGGMATPADTLFTVADLSRVAIELDVFERDLARVRRGQPVAVTVTAYPGRTFQGRVAYLGEVLDPQNRTVEARVEIPNPDGALKPGMFATARIQVGGGGPALVVVPQDALQDVGGRRVVFVPGVRPGEFRPTPVEVGETLDGGRVVIRAGLAPGARVVVAGAFALRSELARAELSEAEH